MTHNDFADVIAVLKQRAPKAVKAVEEKVAELLDCQDDPDAIDAKVEAAMFNELMPGLLALVTEVRS